MSKASERAIRIQEAYRIGDEMVKSIEARKKKEDEGTKFLAKFVFYGTKEEEGTDRVWAHVTDEGRLSVCSGNVGTKDALRLRDFIMEWFGEIKGE